MNNRQILSNFTNKSDLIRRVYEKNPTATNQQIKKWLVDSFGVEVNSNLIISAIGRYRNRIVLGGAASSIIKQAKTYLEICLDDLEQAIHFLKKAKAT